MTKSSLYSALLVWLIPVCPSPVALAQTAQNSSPQTVNHQEQRLRIVTNEVRLPMRVIGPSGRLVTDLTANEVLVIEDGVACQVTGLKREPAHVMIVLDLSANLGIFKSRLEDKKTSKALFERENYTFLYRPVAREFAEIVSRQLIPHNRIAIIQYADRVEILQDWTRNRDEAINALRARFRAGLKARFYDALALAATRLQNVQSDRRVLVLVTDGLDSTSMLAQQSAFESVLATGASIYVLSWTEIILGEAQKSQREKGYLLNRAGEINRYSEQTRRAAEDLKALAAKTGGEYWKPLVLSELMLQKPGELVREINSEYTLTYLSHKDEIDRVPSIPDIRVTRLGVSVLTRQAAQFRGNVR